MPRFTYADLRAMPEDGRRYEVLEGDLCVSLSPQTRHLRIVLHLSLLLGRAEEAGAGIALPAPTDVYLDDANVVPSDLLFVRQERAAIVVEDGVRGASNLVAEVLSSTTLARDLGAKLRIYARFGVGVYGVVDPQAETVTVFEPESRSVRRMALAQKDPAARGGAVGARGRPLDTKAAGRPFAKVRITTLSTS